ncbi:MAG: hypothetical protein ACO225_02765 [Ilumatobacteraceae bacterium]
MAWDASRPVPWRRLIREWLVYVGAMAVVFVIFFEPDDLIGVFAGLLASGPLYLAFGSVLAKFGYQRKTWRELRSESARRPSRNETPAGPKPKPPPTKRTGGGRPGRTKRR